MKYINNKYFKIFLFCTLILVSIIRVISYTSFEKNPCSGYDEQMWTGSSITAYNMFFKDYKRENVRLERWFVGYSQKYNYNFRRMPYEQAQWFDDAIWTFGWKSPNTAKLIMGFFVNTFGENVNPEGYFYHYTANKKENKWPGNYVSDNLIKLARIPNSIMTFLSILIVFIIGLKFFNFYTGFFSSLYLLFNNHFFLINTQARVSSPSIFFSFIVLLFFLLFLEELYKNSGKKIYCYSAIIGFSFPLAVGAKLNAALIGYFFVVFFILNLFLLLKKRRIERKSKKGKLIVEFIRIRENYKVIQKMILCFSIITVLTFIIFIYTNPTLYDKPIMKMVMMQESVKEFFDIRARALNSTDINNSWFVSFWYIIKRNFLKIEFNFLGTFGANMKIKYNFLDFFFFITGFIYLLKESVNRIKYDYKISKELVIIMWSLIFIWGISKFIWIDWGRYYLPLYTTNSIIISVGIVEVLRKIKFILNRKSIFKHKAI